jgi:predicted Zn-dependent protease
LATYAEAYQKEAGNDPELQKLVVQSLYLKGDYPKAQSGAKALAEASRAAGRKPDESVLQLWLSSAFKMGDKAGQRAALTELQTNYPKPGYIADLLALAEADLGHSNRMSLEVFRLKQRAGLLRTSDDYMEMAQLAIQLGLPGEAERVMNDGFAAGAFGGQNKGREQRLLTMAKSQAAKDEPTLGSTAATPEAKAALAEAYVSYGKTDKAIALYKNALSTRFPDDALVRLHLGQALLAEGNAPEARKVFAGIDDAKLAPLARIWGAVAK